MKPATKLFYKSTIDSIQNYNELLVLPTICDFTHGYKTKEQEIVEQSQYIKYLYQNDRDICETKSLSDFFIGDFVGCGFIPCNMKTLIVSHFDHVFNAESNCIQNKCCLNLNDNNVVGRLDNAITNLVVLNYIEELYDNDIGLIFSAFEETSGKGMKRFVQSCGNNESLFVINMDVTKRYADISISEPIYEIPKKKFTYMEKYKNILGDNYFCKLFAFDDSVTLSNVDSWDVVSLCIQTTNNMHSEYCETSVSAVSNYSRAFVDSVNNLIGRN